MWKYRRTLPAVDFKILRFGYNMERLERFPGLHMRSDTPVTIHLKDYLPPAYLVDQVDLNLDLHEDYARVESRLKVRRNPAYVGDERTFLLNGELLELESVQLDEAVLGVDAYRLDDTSLTIDHPPEQFELKTRVLIRPQENTALEGLYRSGGMFCTQCEAEGFRRITYFPDRPDVMARFSTTISADRKRYPVLLSNGNRVQEEELDQGRHRVRWEDPFPKPCYLFALVAGDLRFIQDSYTTISGREVDLRIYVEPENIKKCDHAMQSLKHAMAWDEQHYGREYDLDIYMIVAVNDFNMGAMENKGLNVFNSKFVLARPDSATDRDFQGIEGVIAHEYFHNWTGNRITCRDWFQLSLKEGLTVFRDQEFSADMGSRGVKRIADVRLLRAHQFAEDAGPMAHPIRPDAYMEINNFYTVTVYEKGAEVVRMQHNLLGEAGYRKATDLYFERHDGQAVTTEDFVRCMEDAGGRDLSQFKHWYSLAGTPGLQVKADYDASAQVYSLQVTQHCPDTSGQKNKPPFHIPLAMGLLNETGEDIPLQLKGEAAPGGGTRVVELRQAVETFHFVNVPSRPVPSLLRGLSAPVKIDYGYSDAELTFLMAHDNDDFNRWDAAQTLAQRIILQLLDAHRAGDRLEVPQGFIDAFHKALTDQQADKALLAEVLLLPSESQLGDQMAEVDVDGIHIAREAVKRQLAVALKTSLLEVYHANTETGAYTIDSAAIARRSLKNVCLGYLMLLDEQVIRDLCMTQFEASHNMTDVIAALSTLANTDSPEREVVLATFENRWQDDALVMDKWFTVQALSRLPATLDVVEGLMKHPAFSMQNPNKVRSLIGAFCSGNITGFHAVDGSGYRFLTDRVLELDRLNPQVAARMMRIMTRWQRYDEVRQTLMKREFRRVLSTPDISRDLFEIASKSLEVK